MQVECGFRGGHAGHFSHFVGLLSRITRRGHKGSISTQPSLYEAIMVFNRLPLLYFRNASTLLPDRLYSGCKLSDELSLGAREPDKVRLRTQASQEQRVNSVE